MALNPIVFTEKVVRSFLRYGKWMWRGTVFDRRNPDAARDVASRFFGMAKESVVTVSEAYEPEV